MSDASALEIPLATPERTGRGVPGFAVPAVAVADDRLIDLPAAPITPSDVLAGEPVARAAGLAESPDGRLSTWLWDCTAGRFRWMFVFDEVVHIVDGEVHIRDERGMSFTLRAGDVAHFAPGTDTVWHVPDYVRKVAVSRRRRGDVRWKVVRKLRKLRRG